MEIIADIAEAIIEMGFIFLVLKPRKTGTAYLLLSFIVAVVISGVSSEIVNHIELIQNVDIFIYILVVYAVSEIFLEGEHAKKLSVCAMAEMAISISVYVTMYTIPDFMNTSLMSTLEENAGYVRIVSLVFAKTVQFIFTAVFYYLIRKFDEHYSVNNWQFEAFMMVAVTICSFEAINLISGTDQIKQGIMTVALMVSMLALNFIVLAAVLSLLEKEKEETQFKIFFEKIDIEISQMQDSNVAYEELKNLRHEIRNEYLPIRELLINKNYDAAEAELTRLIGDAEKSFERNIMVETGYKRIDSVLNYYIRLLYTEGAELDYMAGQVDLGSLDEKEVSMILTNLVKNAYEALQHVSEKKAEIKIGNSRGNLLILVSNSIEGTVIDNVNAHVTSKKDKADHGYGVRTIERIVNQKNGIFSSSEENNIFTCKVLLPTEKKNYH